MRTAVSFHGPWVDTVGAQRVVRDGYLLERKTMLRPICSVAARATSQLCTRLLFTRLLLVGVCLVLATHPAVAREPTPYADPLAREVLSGTCAGCHGANGATRGDAPAIGGLSESYLYNTMVNYKTGARHSTVMGRIARGYTDEQLRVIAAYFSAQPFGAPRAQPEVDLIVRGSRLHRGLDCVACHGPRGIAPLVYPEFPRLAGQPQAYLRMTLEGYADPEFPIPPSAQVMRTLLEDLEPRDLDALAAFYASQKL